MRGSVEKREDAVGNGGCGGGVESAFGGACYVALFAPPPIRSVYSDPGIRSKNRGKTLLPCHAMEREEQLGLGKERGDARNGRGA